jgi:hypothetical protein
MFIVLYLFQTYVKYLQLRTIIPGDTDKTTPLEGYVTGSHPREIWVMFVL